MAFKLKAAVQGTTHDLLIEALEELLENVRENEGDGAGGVSISACETGNRSFEYKIEES